MAIPYTFWEPQRVEHTLGRASHLFEPRDCKGFSGVDILWSYNAECDAPPARLRDALLNAPAITIPIPCYLHLVPPGQEIRTRPGGVKDQLQLTPTVALAEWSRLWHGFS